MPKYNLAVTNRFKEKMEITLCDSFDQAADYLDKEVYRRELKLAERFVKEGREKEVPSDLLAIIKPNKPNRNDDADQGNSPEMGEGSGKERKQAPLRA